jgi:hypothetical protein
LVKALYSQSGGFYILAAIVTLLAVVLLGGMKLAQSRYKDAQTDEKESPDALRGCLYVVYRALAGQKGVESPDEGWLRIALHRVDGDKLEQSVDYVGCEDGGGGRIFSIHAGLIGRVARLNDVRTVARPLDMAFDDWAACLVEEYGMMREDAERTRRDRFAFLGIPIRSPGGAAVRAVMYLDCRESDFFDEQSIGLAVNACEGLAEWIETYYYRTRRQG